jgi:hypothetical protein
MDAIAEVTRSMVTILMVASMGITRVGGRVRRIERKARDNEVVEFAGSCWTYLGTPAKCAKSPGPSVPSAIEKSGWFGKELMISSGKGVNRSK